MSIFERITAISSIVLLLSILIIIEHRMVQVVNALRSETIIQEKHIPSYIDADCILQIMEDEDE